MSTPAEAAAEAARVLAELTGVERHDVALVLGSGWLPAVDALGEVTAEISSTDLPGFAAPAVEGHAGKIRSVRAGDGVMHHFRLKLQQKILIFGVINRLKHVVTGEGFAHLEVCFALCFDADNFHRFHRPRLV